MVSSLHYYLWMSLLLSFLDGSSFMGFFFKSTINRLQYKYKMQELAYMYRYHTILHSYNSVQSCQSVSCNCSNIYACLLDFIDHSHCLWITCVEIAVCPVFFCLSKLNNIIRGASQNYHKHWQKDESLTFLPWWLWGWLLFLLSNWNEIGMNLCQI